MHEIFVQIVKLIFYTKNDLTFLATEPFQKRSNRHALDEFS